MNLNIDNPYSEMAIVEIYFDNNLMYKNILYLTEDCLFYNRLSNMIVTYYFLL